MGGMAAFIPSRKEAELNERRRSKARANKQREAGELNERALAKVREDKHRGAGDGFDGTWVAHPDLVPVALSEFDEVLGDRPNQLDRQRPEVSVSAADLLDVASTPGEVTEEGLRNDVSVAIQYLSAWLRGSGAVAIYNLMEGAATPRSRARRSGSGSATAASTSGRSSTQWTSSTTGTARPARS